MQLKLVYPLVMIPGTNQLELVSNQHKCKFFNGGHMITAKNLELSGDHKRNVVFHCKNILSCGRAITFENFFVVILGHHNSFSVVITQITVGTGGCVSFLCAEKVRSDHPIPITTDNLPEAIRGDACCLPIARSNAPAQRSLFA